MPAGKPQGYPAWWFERDVIPIATSPAPETPAYPGDYPTADDYRAANLGQLKRIAGAAYQELYARLPAATCPEALADLMDALELQDPESDYRALAAGQLKRVASLFLQWLHDPSVRYVGPPTDAADGSAWEPAPDEATDREIANLGQLKYAFSFDLSNPSFDSDGDALPDWWELERVAASQADADPDNDLAGIGDVIPGGDFDSGGLSEMEAYRAGFTAAGGPDQGPIPIDALTPNLPQDTLCPHYILIDIADGVPVGISAQGWVAIAPASHSSPEDLRGSVYDPGMPPGTTYPLAFRPVGIDDSNRVAGTGRPPDGGGSTAWRWLPPSNNQPHASENLPPETTLEPPNEDCHLTHFVRSICPTTGRIYGEAIAEESAYTFYGWSGSIPARWSPDGNSEPTPGGYGVTFQGIAAFPQLAQADEDADGIVVETPLTFFSREGQALELKRSYQIRRELSSPEEEELVYFDPLDEWWYTACGAELPSDVQGALADRFKYWRWLGAVSDTAVSAGVELGDFGPGDYEPRACVAVKKGGWRLSTLQDRRKRGQNVDPHTLIRGMNTRGHILLDGARLWKNGYLWEAWEMLGLQGPSQCDGIEFVDINDDGTIVATRHGEALMLLPIDVDAAPAKAKTCQLQTSGQYRNHTIPPGGVVIWGRALVCVTLSLPSWVPQSLSETIAVRVVQDVTPWRTRLFRCPDSAGNIRDQVRYQGQNVLDALTLPTLPPQPGEERVLWVERAGNIIVYSYEDEPHQNDAPVVAQTEIVQISIGDAFSTYAQFQTGAPQWTTAAIVPWAFVSNAHKASSAWQGPVGVVPGQGGESFEAPVEAPDIHPSTFIPSR